MNSPRVLIIALVGLFVPAAFAEPLTHLVFEPKGKANGKHVVLISGDEEYRTEESCPMLGKILSQYHGFKATVLFAINPDGGYIDPNYQKNIPGLEALNDADLMIIGTRFRDLPNEELQPMLDFLNAGKPVIGFRTATHAFNFKTKADLGGFAWKDFGLNILGETWVNHHGKHKKEGCRAVLEKSEAGNPVLNGVKEIFGKTDVYGIKRINSNNATILLRGLVTDSLKPDSQPVAEKNSPAMPLAWLREYQRPNGQGKGNAFCTTMGSSEDYLNEDLRRLIVNASLHLTQQTVPDSAKVTLVDEYKPSSYGFIRNKDFFKTRNLRVEGSALGKFTATRSKSPAKTKTKTKNKKSKKAKKEEKEAAPKSGRDKDGVVVPVSWQSGDYVPGEGAKALSLTKGSKLSFVGGGLGSRLGKFGFFETEIFLRYPQEDLTIRNMCDEGHTPGHRQQPGRSQDNQFAFPGAQELVHPEFRVNSTPRGHYETADQWLARYRSDIVIGFFGFSSSFYGPDDVERFKKELAGFIKHTRSQKYNNKSVPQLALVTPTAFQDLSQKYGTPSGVTENSNLALYSQAMKDVAAEHGVLCVDAFTASQNWYQSGDEYTVDGAILNVAGMKKLSAFLSESLFSQKLVDDSKRATVQAAVAEKNRLWLNDFKIPNGVHVYGRRYKPYGPQNYPDELQKIKEMTLIRDHAVWAALKGESFDVAALDAGTIELPPVPTNYKPSKKNGSTDYKPGEKSVTDIKVAEGYKVELFASEREFPRLANPVQMSFDNKGRLWVATMPSYPHYRVGDALPQDSLLILEDTDGDGKADKETVFADDLHLPIGFEFAPEGVYLSQGDSIVLLKDTNGDDKYDEKEILLSGFDDHDTHHNISAFCADPSGAIVGGEGVFLHTSVETAYGTVRGTNGGFYRYSPQRKHLMRYAQYSIPNPWGVAYDDYGQDFFLHTSSTRFSWMLPGTVKARYGANMKAEDLITSGKVRPTSGIEFVSSRHFPDEVQGDVLINNNIGYLGAKQHQLIEEDTGYTAKFRQDLFVSEDKNFRPVDLEFAPDGSLYFIDWHNVLIGHMQHNARDPYRDHVHGRIYRITYPSRPLVKPAKVDGASIAELLENLKLPEYRTRYRTRRELRGHDADEVVAAAVAWASRQNDEHAKLEALWVTWGANQVHEGLLKHLLIAKDHRVRAAAVRVLRFNTFAIADHVELLKKAATDKHGRVRLEAMVAASYLDKENGLDIVEQSKKAGLDSKFNPVYEFSKQVLNNAKVIAEKHEKLPSGILKQTDEFIGAQINCIIEGISFDVKQIEVPVGKKLKLLLNNPDVMQHNLLIVKPGTADKVANEAIALGADGFGKHFNPGGDDVLVGSKLLNEGEKEMLEVTFDKPGKYPFVCTFPGHATLMRGHIIVK